MHSFENDAARCTLVVMQRVHLHCKHGMMEDSSDSFKSLQESDFDDFDFPHDDTRRIQQPRLKDTGLNTKSFYGKVGTSAPARPRAKGADQEGAKQTTYSQTRQPLPRKRKVEQVRPFDSCFSRHLSQG